MFSACLTLPLRAEHVFPAPRESKVVGSPITISDDNVNSAVVYIVDTNATISAGVDLLNERITALGGASVPVKLLPDNNQSLPLNIFVITVSDDTVSQNIIKQFGIKISSSDPGAQGYVIACRQESGRNEILVAGSDAMGTLYGCVTLAHFIEAGQNSIILTPHNVRDWPDVLYRCMVEAEEARKLYGRYDELVRARKVPESEAAGRNFDIGFKQFIDWMCWNKINRMAPFIPSMRRLDQVERMDRWTAYMEARGISMTWCRSPHVGSAKENLRGCVKRGGTEFCWSYDAKHRQEAIKVAAKIKQLRIKHFMLHMIDNDGADPEMWSQRCDKCKEKFGDNRAAADSHVFMFYYNAIKAAYPECNIEFIPVPYKAWPFYQQGSLELSTEWLNGNPEAIEKKRMSDAAIKYFEQLNNLLPEDVYITLREHGRGPSEKYKKAFGGRPLTIWFWQFPARGWQTFFHNMGRYAKTWDFGDSRGMLFETSNDRPLTTDIISLFNNEYAWNVNAPGSGVMQDAYDYSIGPELLTPTNVTYPFIDQAVKQLYGKGGTPIAEVCKLNLSPMFIARPRVTRVINGESHNVITNAANLLVDFLPMMKYQAEAASKAVDAFSSFLDKDVDLTGRARRDIPVIYHNILAARDVAHLRVLKWESERELLHSKFKNALNIANKGLQYLAGRDRDISRMNMQLKKYPKVSSPPNTVESELENFDFAAFKDSFSLVSRLAQNPDMFLMPELSLVTDSEKQAAIPFLPAFQLSIDPAAALISHPIAIAASKAEDGLNISFRIQRGGAPIEAVHKRAHDNLLLKEPSEQQEYIGLYVRTLSDKNIRIFFFDPRGNKLDGQCLDDKITDAAQVEWDSRWSYHVVSRPNFRQKVDLTWDPDWTVAINTDARYWTATIHLPWKSLGLKDGSVSELKKLGFVFDRYWRSSEPFRPAEYGQWGSFKNGWIPLKM